MTTPSLDPNIQAIMNAAAQAIADAQKASVSGDQLLSKVSSEYETAEKKAQATDQTLGDEVVKIVQAMDEDTLQFLQENT
ncbi:MAG: hypothetical protein Q7S48_04485 [bacterium]|nr:hypothetical protein [bacterium]